MSLCVSYFVKMSLCVSYFVKMPLCVSYSVKMPLCVSYSVKMSLCVSYSVKNLTKVLVWSLPPEVFALVGAEDLRFFDSQESDQNKRHDQNFFAHQSL